MTHPDDLFMQAANKRAEQIRADIDRQAAIAAHHIRQRQMNEAAVAAIFEQLLAPINTDNTEENE